MTYVLSFFAFFGVFFLYCMYRFVRRPEVDKTAGPLWFLCTVWAITTQTKSLEPFLKYIGQDLTEALNIRPDDGKTT